MDKKTKVSTFNKTMTLEEADREKQLNTPEGKSLRQADDEYQRRRKK